MVAMEFVHYCPVCRLPSCPPWVEGKAYSSRGDQAPLPKPQLDVAVVVVVAPSLVEPPRIPAKFIQKEAVAREGLIVDDEVAIWDGFAYFLSLLQAHLHPG